MAARSVGSLFIDIEARTARLEKDLGKARQLLQRMTRDTAVMSKAFSQAFTLARAAIAGFVSIQLVRSVGRMTLATLEATRAQMQLAEATGLSVNDLKAYEEASEHLGVTNLDLTKTMKELFSMQTDVSRGLQESVKDVAAMGMTVEDFLALSPATLFETMVAKLNQIPDPARRSALAFRIFGRESANLSSLLAQGSGAIAKARSEMERLGHTITSLDEAKITVALNAVSELGDRWEVFKKRLSIGLTPLIFSLSMRLANLLASIDIEKFAAKISKWTVALVNFLVTIPTRIKILFQEVKLMWFEFIGQFDTGDSGGFLAKLFGTQAENEAKAQEIRQTLTQLKAALSSSVVGMNEEFEGMVQAALNKILQAAPIAVGAAKNISEGAQEMAKQFATSFANLADVTDQFLEGESVKFGDWFRDIIKTMVKTLARVSIINPILNAMMGGFFGGSAGGWWDNLPSIFGAGKARGGPVMAGDTHVVGEKGPEPVTFTRSGYVTPNDRWVNRSGGGASGLTVNVNNHYSSGLQKAELAAIVPSIVQQSKAAVVDAVMRGGGYRRAMSS